MQERYPTPNRVTPTVMMMALEPFLVLGQLDKERCCLAEPVFGLHQVPLVSFLLDLLHTGVLNLSRRGASVGATLGIRTDLDRYTVLDISGCGLAEVCCPLHCGLFWRCLVTAGCVLGTSGRRICPPSSMAITFVAFFSRMQQRPLSFACLFVYEF